MLKSISSTTSATFDSSDTPTKGLKTTASTFPDILIFSPDCSQRMGLFIFVNMSLTTSPTSNVPKGLWPGGISLHF